LAQSGPLPCDDDGKEQDERRAQRDRVVTINPRLGWTGAKPAEQCRHTLPVGLPENAGFGAWRLRQRVGVSGDGTVRDRRSLLKARDRLLARDPPHQKKRNE